MRSPDEFRFARLTRGLLTVSLTAIVAACGGGASTVDLASTDSVASAQRPNGPSADFPIRVGAPYFVGDTEYVPADVLNYDHVGYATMDQGAMGYSGAHHTLPLPSYVEVTSLETGRTILVRLERRGPMASNHLVALSPAALAQLGASEETAVRVRRVVPPEEQRYLLRAGQAAPLRMDTPQSLLTVLQRRLPEEGAASLRRPNTATAQADPIEVAEAAPSEGNSDNSIARVELPPSSAAPTPRQAAPPLSAAEPVRVPAPASRNAAVPALPPLDADAPAQPAPTEQPVFASAFGGDEARDDPAQPTPAEPAAPAAVAEPEGQFMVQAASFSTRERAERAANVLGGTVTPAGRYFRVRTGPFSTRGEAEASLANVRRAGYTDARIFTDS